MVEIVNLNKRRKARARDERAAEAAENRVRYGRTRLERAREAADAAKAERALEGKRLD
jgi:hypothetical protein